ncbi:hypothetical protein RND81_14G190400 [Saponaria officinalis]|uniref:WRKY domain-containing protein n=1 Tax=Saponaria officinalis TaxID=3572 RepID=A0AAW1GU09_SAPOF
MEFSSSWLSSSTSLDRSNGNNNNGGTLCLFDDSPVREVKKVEVETSSSEVAARTWVNNEAGALLEELNRVNTENKRLTEMLTIVCENYNALKKQLNEYMTKSASNEVVGNAIKKRKVENNTIVNINNHNNNTMARNNNNNVESSSSDEEDSCGKPKEEAIKAKISRVAIRTEASDSNLILKDGYQWRKYGQKVTRDNPCPRAYFKCSFAPSCPVKKKVQRSLEDQSLLVATYEGEHNHAPPTEATSGSSRALTIASTPCNTTLNSTGPTVTLDLTKPKSNLGNETTKMLNIASSQMNKFNSAEFQKLLAEHMASSLTKDPAFTSALAAAISGRFAHHSSRDL